MSSRARIEPILEAIPAARQESTRHYGVHPYFTRRPANVVRACLERYSKEGDVVLDPFGGTGVTAIEAFLLGRHIRQTPRPAGKAVMQIGAPVGGVAAALAEILAIGKPQGRALAVPTTENLRTRRPVREGY